MSMNESCHYLLFPGLFVAFTYNKKQPPAFGASPYFLCTLLSPPGPSFRHIPSNSSNYNVFTNSNANAPLFYQIPGTWSNHEGSISSWCRIPSFYGFPLCYRVQPQSHNVSKRGGRRETVFCSFVPNFVKNSILSLPRYEQQSGAAPQLYTPFVPRTLVPSRTELGINRTFHRRRKPALFYAPLDPGRGRKMSHYASLNKGARRSRNKGLRERAHSKKRTNLSLHLARDSSYRASSIDEQRIYSAVGIALFFSPSLSASSNPFVRNLFVRTEPLAESNPVPQDPILAIHPPCIYAGDVASAMGFGLCRSKMMNGIVALYSPMQKDATGRNRTLRSAGCVGAHVTSELFTLTDAKCHPRSALLLRSNRSLLMLLRRRFFALSSLWTGALLMDTGREQAKRVVRNGKRDTTILPLCWTAGANTVVSDPEKDQEQIRIWILTCRWFLTVGILPGSWWAHHESGRGGRWFRDPVENASSMPWVLATACIHSVIIPKVHSWTLFLNIVTFSCCVSGTSSVRSGLLAPVHSPATDSTRGIFLWRFFLLITGISMILFSQMKQQTSVHRTYKKKIVVARSTLVHLRNSARAQPGRRRFRPPPPPHYVHPPPWNNFEGLIAGSLKPPMDLPSHKGQFVL
uniref:Cytochrome c biogenesis FN n=2 Tax=Cycas TaxID=3395 RepID=A0A8F4MIL5_CYCRE|nr:cytochrome c biogenesis FN [Cycas taitungensis]QXE43894.1 cytochrome c biogenesis FN [Cycas revoluta]BAF98409.1 cytochrome c biogenesis FN [Cycas taitungensis]